MSPSSTSSTAAHPVRSLREHATALEAAILLCLAEPSPDAVHQLRAAGRRIEALLDLLVLIKNLPPFRVRARKLLRPLRKLRRAAGLVRDLDVQQKLIADNPLPGDAGSRKAADFADSRRKLRKRAAKRLHEELMERHRKVVRRLEVLLTALEPASDLALSTADLLALAHAQFEGIHAFIIRNPSPEHLHSIRKAAKIARYQAELAPGFAPARRAAGRYHALQVAGGLWHDWSELAETASVELGHEHALTIHFAQQLASADAAYRKALAEFRNTLST